MRLIGPQYSLDQVAGLAGVPRRTIRYTSSSGSSIGRSATRAAHYTWQHLRQLLEVRLEQGFSLERVRELQTQGDGPTAAAT